MKFIRRESGLYRAMASILIEDRGRMRHIQVAVNVVRLVGGPHRWSYEIVATSGNNFGRAMMSRWDIDAVTFKQAKELAVEAVSVGLVYREELGWCLRDPHDTKDVRPSDSDLLKAARTLEANASQFAEWAKNNNPDVACLGRSEHEALLRVAVWLENQTTPVWELKEKK